MKRRDVLKRASAIGIAGLVAGCTGQRQAPSGGGDGGDDETTTTTTTEPPVSIASKRVVESGGTCGQENRASVTFEDGKVVVEGAIPVNDPCYKAEIASSTFDDSSGALEVTMAPVATESDVCQQCLGKVVYEAEITFSNGNAKKVTVSHEGMDGTSEVATAMAEDTQ